MIEEVRLKIGIYEALIEPSQKIALQIYESCGNKNVTSCIIHRKYVLKITLTHEIIDEN